MNIKNIIPFKLKKSSSPKYDTDELIQNSFIVQKTELEKNINKIATYQKATPRERLVKIVAVQKIWDYNENGEYVFGVLGYTIQEVQDYFILNSKKIRLNDHWFACSQKDITI